MFTVLSNTRNSNLYLIAALAIVAVVLLTFAVVPAISAPAPAFVPVTGVSETGSDYYLRHPELRIPAGIGVDVTGDFFLRHPQWMGSVQNAAIPVTGQSAALDYFQRHPEWNVSAVDKADVMGDFSLRHPGWIISLQNEAIPVTGQSEALDYFQRHPELSAPVESGDLSDYFLRH